MLVSIGSGNGVKINAAKKALKMAGFDAEVVSVEVASGVKSQPMSNEEGITGAINRATNSMKKTGAELGIGMEGTVQESEYGMFLTGWTAVVDINGRLGLGSSGSILLPEKMAKRLREGEELGNVIDEIEGKHDIKRGSGTIGILSRGTVNREDEFTTAALLALARIVSSEYYE